MTTTAPAKIRLHLAKASGRPACGRQLHSGRPGEGLAVTNQENVTVTSDFSLVSCKHCLRAIGALAPVARQTIEVADDSEGGEDE